MRATTRAARRLAKGADKPEVLHDLRVALRRRRSLLRLHPALLDCGCHADRRRLKRLARATSPARDADVLLALLGHHRVAAASRIGVAIAPDRTRAYDSESAAWWRPMRRSAGRTPAASRRGGIRVKAGSITAALRRPLSTVAAVDLGSNSFHLIVAQIAGGALHVVDRMQEMVRLGGGLDARGRLSAAARRRALECLARFGQRLRGLPRGAVRAVGTNTLRQTKDAASFLAAAERALGHPIEVIAGREEARLIYQGMAQSRPDDGRRRLVIDIGGGSTELIIGEGREALAMESLHMGCVSMSRAHFGDGRIGAKAMRRAETAARLELRPVEEQFRRGWEVAIGTSGTIRAIRSVVRAEGWGNGEITTASLARLRAALIDARRIGKLALGGLSPERAPVFPGGVAILGAIFDALGVERLQVADGALREGLLYDLVGRLTDQGVRERSVSGLAARFRADGAQAERVARTAAELFRQLARTWVLDDDDGRMLGWAARLHEIGLVVAHNQYHKHGAYLVAKADLPGFSLQEQQLLATLIRGHRRKFPAEVFEALPAGVRLRARRLGVLLRLAALLNRARHDVELRGLKLRPGKRSLRLQFGRGWLKRHPLTQADLEQEAEYLRAAGIRLEIS